MVVAAKRSEKTRSGGASGKLFGLWKNKLELRTRTLPFCRGEPGSELPARRWCGISEPHRIADCCRFAEQIIRLDELGEDTALLKHEFKKLLQCADKELLGRKISPAWRSAGCRVQGFDRIDSPLS